MGKNDSKGKKNEQGITLLQQFHNNIDVSSCE